MVWNTRDPQIQPFTRPEWTPAYSILSDEELECVNCDEVIEFDDNTTKEQIVRCEECGTEHKLIATVDYEVQTKRSE